MSHAKIFAFENSAPTESFESDLTMLSRYIGKTLKATKEEFIIVTDYHTLDKHIDEVNSLKGNSHFQGIVLSVEPNLFTLSHSVLQENLFASILKKLVTVESEEAMSRIIHAWAHEGQDALIGDFKVDSLGGFYLLDCRLKVHKGSLKDFDLFESATNDQLHQFELNKFGNFIFWPELDVHLDLNFFKRHLDSDFAKKEMSRSLKMKAKLGEKMRKLREQKGLKQADFEGLSERQIRRYENGEMNPSYSSLELIAKRMKMTVTEYLDEVCN